MPRLNNLDRVSGLPLERFKIRKSRIKATGTMFLAFVPVLALMHITFTVVSVSPSADPDFLSAAGFILTSFVSGFLVSVAFFASAVWASGWRARFDYEDDSIMDKCGVTAYTEWLYSGILLTVLIAPFLIWNRMVFGTSIALLCVPILASWFGLVLGIGARRRIIRYRPRLLWWTFSGILILGVGAAGYVAAYYHAHY